MDQFIGFDTAKALAEVKEQQEKYIYGLIDMLGITQEEFIARFFIENVPLTFEGITDWSFSNDSLGYKIVESFRVLPKASRPDLFPEFADASKNNL